MDSGRTVYLAHGFNVRDPRMFFKLGAPFAAAGFNVVEIDYGWTGLISARRAVRNEGARLAENARPGDVAIGHSNGCALIAEAMERGASLQQFFFINPALDKERAVNGVARGDIYYADDDIAVVFGKWLRRLSPLRLFKQQTTWGEMGRTGYVGKDTRFHNHSLRMVLEADEERIGHGGAFKWHNVAFLSNHMIKRILPYDTSSHTPR